MDEHIMLNPACLAQARGFISQLIREREEITKRNTCLEVMLKNVQGDYETLQNEFRSKDSQD